SDKRRIFGDDIDIRDTNCGCAVDSHSPTYTYDYEIDWRRTTRVKTARRVLSLRMSCNRGVTQRRMPSPSLFCRSAVIEIESETSIQRTDIHRLSDSQPASSFSLRRCRISLSGSDRESFPPTRCRQDHDDSADECAAAAFYPCEPRRHGAGIGALRLHGDGSILAVVCHRRGRTHGLQVRRAGFRVRAMADLRAAAADSHQRHVLWLGQRGLGRACLLRRRAQLPYATVQPAARMD